MGSGERSSRGSARRFGAGRGRTRQGLCQGAPRARDVLARQHPERGGVRRICEAGAQAPLSQRGGAACPSRRAEDGRPLRLAHLPQGRAHKGGDEGRWGRGRGCDRQCAHHQGCLRAEEAAGRREQGKRQGRRRTARGAGGARGGLHGAGGTSSPSTRLKRRRGGSSSPIRATPPPVRCASWTPR